MPAAHGDDVAELDLPAFDYLDTTLVGPAFRKSLGDLRAQHWLAALKPFGYLVLGRAAVDAVLRTPAARMPAIEILELQGVTDGPIHEQLSRNLINLEGEEHRRLRSLVHGAFQPRAVEALRPSMRRHLDELFELALGADDPVEFVSAIAKPYPARMIAEIVGVPTSDADRLGEWAYWIQSTFDPVKVAGETERIAQAAMELRDYLRALLPQPSPDGGEPRLLDSLRIALAEGQIDEPQTIALVTSVLIGGVDTTQSQLAHAVRLFAEHPDQWDAVVSQPSLIPAATEEVLRFEPITPFTARLVTRTFTHDGVTFPPGTLLIACALTANQDPQTYQAPDVFDVTADRGGQKPLTFGAGPHYCLGAALARAELEEALQYMAARIKRIELAAAPVYDTPAGVYGLRNLAVRLLR